MMSVLCPPRRQSGGGGGGEREGKCRDPGAPMALFDVKSGS